MRVAAGLILIAAALLKGIQFVVDPSIAWIDPLGPRFVQVAVGIELALGLLMLSGWYWQSLRWAAIALFGALAAYSLHLALGGADSCGCFGPLKIHPWWTFLLDLTIVVSLYIPARVGRALLLVDSQQSRQSLKSQLPMTASAATMSGVVAIPLLLALSWSSGENTKGIVVLDSEAWIGRPLPIAQWVDVDFAQGQWIVLFYRRNCQDCLEALARYEELASQLHDQRVALIEVPPYGEDAIDAGRGMAFCGKLSSEREWFVKTPLEIQITGGIVTHSSHNALALGLHGKL